MNNSWKKYKSLSGPIHFEIYIYIYIYIYANAHTCTCTHTNIIRILVIYR